VLPNNSCVSLTLSEYVTLWVVISWVCRIKAVTLSVRVFNTTVITFYYTGHTVHPLARSAEPSRWVFIFDIPNFEPKQNTYLFHVQHAFALSTNVLANRTI